MPVQNPLITSCRRVSDWLDLRAKLIDRASLHLWHEAFEDFFAPRIYERYLNPARQLQVEGDWSGEGYSIVAIQCSLIEFLESTVQGCNYVHRDPKINEYKDSGPMFQSFLLNRAPFKSEFNIDIAKDFYRNVRCGIVHEAHTKGGWVIHAVNSSRQIIDYPEKILYRDCFQMALVEFLNWYESKLPTDPALQQAFLRRMSGLWGQ